MPYHESPDPPEWSLIAQLHRDNEGASTWKYVEPDLQVGIEWAFHRGRLEPVSVTIRSTSGQPVRAGAIRTLPLGEIMNDSRTDIDELAEVGEPATTRSVVTIHGRTNQTDEEQAKAEAELKCDLERRLAAQGMTLDDYVAHINEERKATERRFRKRGAQRGQALTPDDLQLVADAYRSAWREGRSVNEAVINAAGGGLSHSGAAKRIQAARSAGLLEGVGPKR